MRVGRFAGRFVRNVEGATAIEFGLLALPFLAMLLFSLQLAIIIFADQSLLTFNEAVSRNILTGSTQGLGLTGTQFKTKLCAQLPVLFSCNRFAVDVQSGTAFANANLVLPTLTINGAGSITNTFAFSPGAPGNVVVVRMMYNWPVVGTLIGSLANQGVGNHLITSTVVFQSEQYGP